jgi:hypothetical protein
MNRAVVIAGLLAAAMFATRMEHFGTIASLPDASLAVFFFAGMWLVQRRWFVLLSGVATLTDYYAFAQSGVSESCFTPAYPFLAAAYGCLWVAGERVRVQATDAIAGPMLAAVVAIVGAFAISNLSFFAFSGQFAAMTVGEYVARTVRYAPSYVIYAVLYVAAGLALRALWARRAEAAARRPV